MIDYTLVSEGAILRDYIDVPYKNDEHKLLVDIADSMYNVGIDPDDFKDEYKKVYKQYGDDYFTKVIQDMEALDSQLYNDSKVEELVADYQDRLGTVSESCKKNGKVKKNLKESVYLDNGETLEFFATNDADYLYEWAEIIREKLGQDAYREFKEGVIDDMFNPKDGALEELGNQYKELRKTFGELGDFILKSELDDDTKETLNEVEEDIQDKIIEIGDTLCYEFGVIDSKDV